MGVPVSIAQLQAHFDEHLGFLRSSCAAFDVGQTGEAKRIAHALRVLFHDTASSHSICGQLSILQSLNLPSTRPELTYVEAKGGGGVAFEASFRPMLSDGPPVPPVVLPFEGWWNETIVFGQGDSSWTRRSLVLTVANKDGGSHVDPQLDVGYAKLLVDGNGWGFQENSVGGPILGIERASLRQVAHEVLSVLGKG